MDAIEPEEEAGFCDCCPHAAQGAETLATLMYHLEGALRRQNENTAKLREAAEAMRRMNEELALLATHRAEDEAMLENLTMENYELKQKLVTAQQQVARVCEKHAEVQRFLAALGYSKRLQTTEEHDAPPA